MKLSLNTDFTKLPRAGSILAAADVAPGAPEPFDVAVLPHDERHLRRRVIELAGGEKMLVDLPEPVMLGTGDRLVLDDGRHAGIVAAEEELFDIRARDAVHLAELAWHIGNRHLAAAIEPAASSSCATMSSGRCWKGSARPSPTWSSPSSRCAAPIPAMAGTITVMRGRTPLDACRATRTTATATGRASTIMLTTATTTITMTTAMASATLRAPARRSALRPQPWLSRRPARHCSG